jgi:hypothetical protein
MMRLLSGDFTNHRLIFSRICMFGVWLLLISFSLPSSRQARGVDVKVKCGTSAKGAASPAWKMVGHFYFPLSLIVKVCQHMILPFFLFRNLNAPRNLH